MHGYRAGGQDQLLRKVTYRASAHTLQTLAPAPAATMAAVVLTLKVLCPSPPVPTISTTHPSSFPSTSAVTALSFRTSAAAPSSSGRCSARATCSAVKKAPTCEGWTAGGDERRWSNASRKSAEVNASGDFTSVDNRGLKVSDVSSSTLKAVGAVDIVVVTV